MINDSANVSPVFIEEQPDWSKPVQVVIDYKTTVAESRNETKQRARWRKQPRYSISYQISGLTLAEFSQRRTAMLNELKAPCVVPIWTDEHELDSVSGDVFTLTEDVTLKKFKVGSYAYLIDGTTTAFRKIVAIDGIDLTFESGSFPAFPAGAKVHPCIAGFRTKGSAAFALNLVDRSDETITIEEL